MDLPDCPPGTEGYEDSVVEKPKNVDSVDTSTKAEQEFKDHLNSLKIKVEDGSARCMIERRGRDVAGKWIYLCYPCAAVCSGESILQTHISGKKHKTKLALRNVWPLDIFDNHPYIKNDKKPGDEPKEGEKALLAKMAEEVSLHNTNATELDQKYGHLRRTRAHLQDTLDDVKAPLLGVEYLAEFLPEESHYERSYMCLLCNKNGHPRTIINHMVSYWHRYNYIARHYFKAHQELMEYRSRPQYREGINLILNRLAQRIEDTYGRLRPFVIDKIDFNKEKEQITQWIYKGYHFSDKNGQNFIEVVDKDLIETLFESAADMKASSKLDDKKRDPSPPRVAAPVRPPARERVYRSRREPSPELEDEDRYRGRARPPAHLRERPHPPRDRRPSPPRHRPENPYLDRRDRKTPEKEKKEKKRNMEHKMKLAEDQSAHARLASEKQLAYHEKNPEKHPLYPEEWKKFWNRRYKELQAEGKDASKHDFKPEWIVFWTQRMKELHAEEVQNSIEEIYRRLSLPLPEKAPRRSKSPLRRYSRSPGAGRHRSRSRSPVRFDLYGRAPRRGSPPRRVSPLKRSRSPSFRRGSPGYGARAASPASKRRRSPAALGGAGAALLDIGALGRSKSPLSLRGAHVEHRNRSPGPGPGAAKPPSLQTVVISDEELKPSVGGASPWNDSDSLESLGSLPEARSPLPAPPRSRSRSVKSSSVSRRRAPSPPPTPHDDKAPDDVVSTLRLLVALEDYLGSLGPRIVDLLTDALRMEKERPNSSEELLDRESCVALIETGKEKLKGALQAGLVASGAAAAVRRAVTRAAHLAHLADTRARQKQAQKPVAGVGSAGAGGGGGGMRVAGVGSVDKATIAREIAAELVAQGKTNVTTEELAQLVDAVVGMAEAKKKREIAAASASAAPAPAPAALRDSAAGAGGKGTGSALQLLQSAYDEQDKAREEPDDKKDAMDGLSDSDLKTLLQNFGELMSEEQHGLIAYLKKLEAREPKRVERLREYVSAAVASTPPAPVEAKGDAAEKPHVADAVNIESDDDDYTVEEVFKSAAEKVKETQIQQELEIVKKSLQQQKKKAEAASSAEAKTPAGTSGAPTGAPALDMKAPDVQALASLLSSVTNATSAANLLALVQASVQAPAAAPTAPPTTAVTTVNQPLSFGDKAAQMSAPIQTIGQPQVTPQSKPIIHSVQIINPGTPVGGQIRPGHTMHNPANLLQPQPASSIHSLAPSYQDNRWGNQQNKVGDPASFNSAPPPNNNSQFNNQNFNQGIDNNSYNQNDGGYNQNAPNTVGYGQNDGSYGQNDGNYGQNDGNYGQNDGNYGQNDGNYGQNDGNYGQNDGNYGQNDGNYDQGNGNYAPDKGYNDDGFNQNNDGGYGNSGYDQNAGNFPPNNNFNQGQGNDYADGNYAPNYPPNRGGFQGGNNPGNMNRGFGHNTGNFNMNHQGNRGGRGAQNRGRGFANNDFGNRGGGNRGRGGRARGNRGGRY